MTELPSLDNLSPNAWVAAMHAARQRTVQEIADVLDLRTTPREAAPGLQSIFDNYRPEEPGRLFEQQLAAGERVLEVRAKEDSLVLWVYPSENYETLVYTADDCWWFDHSGIQSHDLSRHELHRQVAERLVRLLPWANDDDLLELAAIESATRAG